VTYIILLKIWQSIFNSSFF